jgi:hypothetical protein
MFNGELATEVGCRQEKAAFVPSLDLNLSFTMKVMCDMKLEGCVSKNLAAPAKWAFATL